MWRTLKTRKQKKHVLSILERVIMNSLKTVLVLVNTHAKIMAIQKEHNYFTRHSGLSNKKAATIKEIRKSGGYYNPKIFSHIYLW